MIKFRGKDGDTKFEMNDQGDLKFEDKAQQDEFETAEEKMNEKDK